MNTIYTIIATLLSYADAIVGAMILVAGGFWLALFLVSSLARLAGQAWIKCSRKWRYILKAEETILQFRREREDYLAWKKRQKNER